MPKPASVLSPNLSRRREVRKPSLRSRGGIVVTQNRIASEVGARVLKAGGHAVDAAVAAAFAVGIAEPWMSGIGGVCGMLVYDARSGRVTGIDGGGRSPKRLDPRDFPLAGGVDKANLFGWALVEGQRNTIGAKAIATPGEPAAIALAHKMFGRKRWRDLVAPAVKLAEDGIVVDWHTMLVISSALDLLRRDPAASTRFLRNGLPPVPLPATVADATIRLPMPDLARTLRTIAEEGARALYEGPLARAIAEDVAAAGGYLAEADLGAYEAGAVEPLEIGYRERTISVLPELNGGPTLFVAFEELKRQRKRAEAKPNGRTFGAYAAALKTAWKDRFERMGDAGDRSAPTSTTHLCVVDRDGNMVTLTQTLLSLFGSGVVLPKTGILMNNGINWFDPVPSRPNSIAPDARALANYVPAIMTGGGEQVAIGGCGGRKIIPAVFQLLAMIEDFGFDLDAAFHQPRIDVSGGPTVAVDRRLGEKTVAALAESHEVVLAEPVVYPFPFTIASAVRRKRGLNEGATEPEQPWGEAVGEDEV